MKRLISALFLFLSLTLAFADVNTDRTMSKIAHDTKTYISADARAASEQEAYDAALAKLTELVADYLKETSGGNAMPDAIYLPQMSGIYDRLTNHIGDNRYRVMLYVKKSDIKPMSNTSGAVVLSKNEDNEYSVLPTTPTPQTEPVVVTDTVTVVQVVEKPLDPTLSLIASKKTKDEITTTIQSLAQSGNLGGAAKFPIEKANDFYVAVIDKNDSVKAILHCLDGQWTLVPSGEEADLNMFKDCSAYWFTLSSK